jgi:AraC-like DNA-binding protein
LKRDAGTVSEIAYSVGFSDPSHFTRRFRELFGTLPSDVRKNPSDQT